MQTVPKATSGRFSVDGPGTASNMSDTPFAHALTIDVEGFAESHAESVRVDPSLLDSESNDREIGQNLSVTLELLAEHNCRATFFFLGRIAKTSPRLVKQVADAGHEIGCHSLLHRRVSGQTAVEFRSHVTEARQRLEDSSGQSVIGFRAPFFSIGAGDKLALDTLATCGFLYDSSVVPTRFHNVHVTEDVARGIFHWPNGLVEFPLPVFNLFGQALPIGGGGYFRLYPLCLSAGFFQREMRRGTPAVFYIHPYEIGPVAPRLPGLSMLRRFRHYVRLGSGGNRFPRLLNAMPFTTMSEVLVRTGHLSARV